MLHRAPRSPLFPYTTLFRSSNDGSGGAQADVAVNCGEVSMTKIPDATSVSAGDQAGFTVSLTNTGTGGDAGGVGDRSEEHTSELQSHHDLVCRLLLEKKKTK